MSKPVHILGIAGSLRARSYNRAALRAAMQLAPPGATIDIFEIDSIPPFSEDDEQDRVSQPSRRRCFVIPNPWGMVLERSMFLNANTSPLSGRRSKVEGCGTQSG